ncbi:MAG TPA: bifunctional 4-hydroxy-2-oxoglutarate aldolase/2-dehydro-3-deoxy-phosphogluconate aldolase [Bacillota bacterium]|nr:bifunctional 4-hydroxy-2-oxoglutarate aldolase/2-dehydro-3-deoxy-phosphogluconate aldolase [Bacillota bacterium]
MYRKLNLLNRLVENGVIAVIRRVPLESAIQVAQSLIEGGVNALEITVDHPSAYEAIQRVSTQFGDRAIIGAGTVLDSESAKLAIQSGAEFVFSPSLHPDVIRTALRYGKIAVPGVMTPTEMIQALELGADLVKLFPASGLGVKFIKDIRGPFPHVPIIPTGGVNLENVASFIEAGVAAVGIGGNLVNLQAINKGDFASITATAKQYVQSIKEARSKQQ